VFPDEDVHLDRHPQNHPALLNLLNDSFQVADLQDLPYDIPFMQPQYIRNNILSVFIQVIGKYVPL
jgi:hypothetical protein